MARLIAEFDQLRAREYQLQFRIPTLDELATMCRLHRDVSEESSAFIKKSSSDLLRLLDGLSRGDIRITDLPPALRTRLRYFVDEDVNGDVDG